MNASRLETAVGSVTLANPVLAASGTAAFGSELRPFGIAKLGGIVLKTVTPEPRTGNPPPRVMETPAGMLNAIGLENPGIDALLDGVLQELSDLPCALVASIHADEVPQLAAMAGRLAGRADVAAVEVNLSCPNVPGGTAPSNDTALAGAHVAACVGEGGKPVWAKISPESPVLLDVVACARDAGAEAVVIANTYRGAAVDWRTGASLLGAGTGGLSGPAIRPLALFKVALVARRIDIPVVASGGALDAHDVLNLMAVGAAAVEVGTATFVDPTGVCRLPEDIDALLAQQGVASVRDITGTVNIFPDA